MARFNLKSLKSVTISSNGCIYFNHLPYTKFYQKHIFLKEVLFANLAYSGKFKSKNFNFFYKKYRK